MYTYMYMYYCYVPTSSTIIWTEFPYVCFERSRGAFSEVYRAIEKDTHKEYAIKVIKKDALKGKEEALQMEVQVLQKWVAPLCGVWWYREYHDVCRSTLNWQWMWHCVEAAIILMYIRNAK